MNLCYNATRHPGKSWHITVKLYYVHKRLGHCTHIDKQRSVANHSLPSAQVQKGGKRDKSSLFKDRCSKYALLLQTLSLGVLLEHQIRSHL